jgi:hypothetical protein
VAAWEPRTTAKQRLTGVRLHRALQEEGYQIGLTMIHEYLRERRRQRAEVYVPLMHRAGDEAQVDFFEVTVELNGEWHKAWKFLLRLMYSGREFVWLYQRCDTVAFLTLLHGLLTVQEVADSSNSTPSAKQSRLRRFSARIGEIARACGERLDNFRRQER